MGKGKQTEGKGGSGVRRKRERSKARSQGDEVGGRTHKLVGLFYDNNALTVIAQPHGGVGTGRTAANDDNVPRDGLFAATTLGGDGSRSRGCEAEAEADVLDLLTHLSPRNATRYCSIPGIVWYNGTGTRRTVGEDRRRF
jgi:hypothetical protein